MELQNLEDEEKDVVDEFTESPRSRRKLLLNGSMSIIQETDEEIEETNYNHSIVSAREG